MPRQTCGIFTHTIYFRNYPNGIDSLVSTIEGGELFNTVLTNQVLVFMTHMTNYANDRLALFVFEKLFNFIGEWTNIKFKALPPVEMARKYFEIYPQDKEPLWTNICDDHRHIAIWHLKETDCHKYPKLIIIGPQKTGNNNNNYFNYQLYFYFMMMKNWLID
jgi:hypothetical protein